MVLGPNKLDAEELRDRTNELLEKLILCSDNEEISRLTWNPKDHNLVHNFRRKTITQKTAKKMDNFDMFSGK